MRGLPWLLVVVAVGTAGCTISRAPAVSDAGVAATDNTVSGDTAAPPAPSVSPATTGKGSATITFTAPAPGTPTVVRLQSTSSGNFTVDALDAGSSPVDDLVAVDGTYDGTVLVDADPSEARVAKLRIQAPGPWSVEVQPASTATELTGDGIEGERDTVLRYTGTKQDATFTFDGDGQAELVAYAGLTGGAPDTLVTQSGASQSAAPIELPGPVLLQVQAQGPWAIRLAGA